MVVGFVIRWWVAYVDRPICPRLNDGTQPGCFNVGGDALFGYWQGRLVAMGKGFLDPVAYFLEDGRIRQSAAKPPLYPGFLAVLGRLGLESAEAQRFALLLVGCVTIVLVALVGRHLGGERGDRVGLIAAGLAAVAPAFWINDTMLQVEPLSTLAVAGALLLAYRFRARPTVPLALGLAATLAAGAMLRAEMQLMIPAVLWPMVVTTWTWSRWRRLGVVVGGTALAVAMWSPWLISNQHRLAAASPWAMTSGSGAVLVSAYCDETYFGEALGYWAAHCFDQPRSTRIGSGESLRDAVDRVTGDGETSRLLIDAGRVQATGQRISVDVDRRVLDESQYYNVAAHTAWEFARDHPGRFPVVVVARVGRTLNLFRPFDTIRIDGTVEGRGEGATQLSLAFWWLSLPLGIWGAVLLRRRGVTLIPLIGVSAVVIGTAAASFGVMRYRVPVDLCVVLLAAVAVDELWAQRRSPSLVEQTERLES